MARQKIYLMKNDFGLYKIGISNNPVKRANTITNNSGVPTEVVNTWDAYHPYRTEQYLHKNFKHLRLKGEWFKLKDKQIKTLDTLIEQNDKILDCKTIPANILDSSKQLPCLCPTTVFTNYSIPKDIEDMNALLQSHGRTAQKLFKKGQVEYKKVMDILESKGYKVPWGILSYDGSYMNLPNISILGGTYYPVCNEKQMLHFELIISKQKVAWAEEYLESAKKNLANAQLAFESIK